MEDKDINNLKEIVDLCEKEIKNNNYNATAILDITDLKSLNNLLNELERLQKENEELKRLHINIQGMRNGKELLNKYITDSIPKQVIQYKIEELNDVSNAEELEDIMDGKNYTITELVQYVLQELLESEE